MKKKILSILLCLSMAVCMLAGCSKNGVDTTSGKVDTTSGKVEQVKVTDKLEKKYIERIEAYQAYFDEIRNKYSDYKFSATVTLDKEGLPLFWLTLSESGDWDDITTQLVGFEDGKAKILAEKRAHMGPHRDKDLIMAQKWNSDSTFYLYDEEKQDFITVVIEELMQDRTDENALDTIYTEKELEEKIDLLSEILESADFFDSVKIRVNDSTHQIAYFGRTKQDYYYNALVKLWVLLEVNDTRGFVEEPMGEFDKFGVVLRKEYADNKEVLNYFKQLPDAELDEELRAEILSHEEADSYIYGNLIKEIPNVAYILPDGTVCTGKEAFRYIQILDYIDDEYSEVSAEAVGEYFDELSVERILRYLQKNPAYTQEDLYLSLASVAYDCEVIEVDMSDYILKNTTFVSQVVAKYISGNDLYEAFFTDELIEQQTSISETKPYKTIREEGVDERSYADNVLTLLCGNIEYQFQIEFDDSGEMVSGITYIDPTASMSEEEKQEYMVKTEVIPAYKKNVSNADRYTLVYINDDSIPELITSTASWYNFYTYDNDVIALDLSANVFAIIEKENLIHISSGHGTFYDYIGNLKEGAFECLKEGKYGDVYDANGNRVPDAFEYYWEGQQVSEEEYNNSLAQIFDAKKAISSNDLIYYSSIQEAYENLNKTAQPSAVEAKSESAVTKYYDLIYNYTNFWYDGKSLSATTYDGEISLNMEVSDDCVWQYRGSDGSISESSYEKIYELWEADVLWIQEWLDSEGLDFSALSDYEFMESQGYGTVLDSPTGLGVEVQDEKIIAVYYTSP